MNKWQKIGLAVGMGTAVITTTHLINSIIFKLSTANNYTGKSGEPEPAVIYAILPNFH